MASGTGDAVSPLEKAEHARHSGQRASCKKPPLWPDADLVQRLPSRRLLGVKRTRYAHRELFRV
jgi:hypothetical protein